VCVGILSDVFRDRVTVETRSGGGLLGSYLKGLCEICSSSQSWHVQQGTSVPFALGCRAQSDGLPWQMPNARHLPPFSLVLATLSAPMSRAGGCDGY